MEQKLLFMLKESFYWGFSDENRWNCSCWVTTEFWLKNIDEIRNLVVAYNFFDLIWYEAIWDTDSNILG